MKIRCSLVLALLLASMTTLAVDIQLTPYVSGLSQLTDLRHAGDGSGRMFAVRRTGLISLIRADGTVADEPFLDITAKVGRNAMERGLLSMAFEPNYSQTGRFYVFYTDRIGSTVVERYEVRANDPDSANPNSGEILLTVGQPFDNHNGGRLVFGQDGYLYLGLGDGGSANDPQGNGQNDSTLLGKLLRMDVVNAESGYLIPPDNPNVGNAFPNEIFAKGLRNPWRMAVDKVTGDLYIADVGQVTWEEVNFLPAGTGANANFGWFPGEGVTGTPGLTDPVFAYTHDGSRCSITGGEVYRGPDYPDLYGTYFFGDFCTSEVFSLTNDGGSWSAEVVANTDIGIVTFGTDERGNIFVGGQGGTVLLLSDGPPVEPGPGFDGSSSGTFAADGLPDQGLSLHVAPQPNGKVLVAAGLFTYDSEGNDMWLLGTAVVDIGATIVQMAMDRFSGPVFLDFMADRADREPVGSLTLHSAGCDSFWAEVKMGDLGNAAYQYNRVTSVEGRECVKGAQASAATAVAK